jgi:hypothetical protein
MPEIEPFVGQSDTQRWIAGSSHSIVNYIPHENFAAMINVIHKYGTY